MNKNENNQISRRSTFGVLASIGAGAYLIPAWNETVEAADTIACVASTPTVTEGPYWIDEKLFRSDIRTDPSTGTARAGIPLTLTIKVQNLTSGSCTALAGAYVDVWHCDAKGIYSDESTYNPGGGTGNVNTSGQKFLRGYQITGSDGSVTFTTIYPGWYSGRTIHIHFRVRTYSGTTVAGNFVSQIFFDETTNNAVLAQSAYSRSSNRDTLNSNDMVYQVSNKERMLATVTGNNTDGYAAVITAGVTLAAPTVTTPAISAGGVVNAVSGAAGVSPGSWVSIFGTNFAIAAQALAATDVINKVMPTQLGGVSVQINGKAAYIGYVSPTQLNVLAPADIGTGTTSLSVTNSAGSSNVASAVSQAVLPGLSAVSSYVRAVRYPDGAIVNGTGAAESGYITSAAIGQGDVLSLYGTGFGPTSYEGNAGAVFSGAYATTNTITVSIGSVPADVLWSGLIGPGLYQINVRIPASLPDGNQAVVASVAGLTTQSGALLRVAASARLSAQVQRTSVFARVLRVQAPQGAVLLYSDDRMPDTLRLAGLDGSACDRAGSHVTKLSLQADERQTRMVQLA